VATTSKYFVTSSATENFVDLDLSYGSLSLAGQTVVYTGSSQVDSVFVRPGLSFDFTASGAGADKVYLEGNFADYTVGTAGANITLSRGEGASAESVTVTRTNNTLATDRLVFADGTVNTLALYNDASGSGAAPLPTGETSLAPVGPAAEGAAQSASLRAFAQDPNGETFALTRPGVNFSVVGSAGIDTVYVQEGATVDTTGLGGGADLIYMRGEWAEYTKTVSGTRIVFERTVDGNTERITVSAASGASNDRLVFADGSALSNDARAALAGNPLVAVDQIPGYTSSEVTPGISWITVESVAFASTPVNGKAYGAGEQVLVQVQFSDEVQVDTAGGVPFLTLDVAGAPKPASYVSGSGTNTLVFAYRVALGDADANGIAMPSDNIALNGGRLLAASGQPVDVATSPLAEDAAQVVTGTNTVMLRDLANGSSQGFVMNGMAASDWAGGRADVAGDVNGDGFADVVVGASGSDPGGRPSAGRSFVVFGGSSMAAVDLSSLTGGTSSQGFVINGSSDVDRSGISVSEIGDFNGDGLADLVVGADLADPDGVTGAGRSYVVFGRTSTAPIDLSALDAGTTADGFALNGESAGDGAGWTVAGAGDVNGDGYADLLIGAVNADPGGLGASGRSYVVYGRPGSETINLSALTSGSNPGGFIVNGASAGDLSAYSLDGVGDVNGDGLADVLIGVRDADPGGQTNAGSAFLLFGRSGSETVDLSSIASGTGTRGFMVNGIAAGDKTGYTVADAGDVNGDGLSDFLVGAMYTDFPDRANAGTAYVVFGKADALPVNLSEMVGRVSTHGFAILGAAATDITSYALSGAGDINGDGLADVLVSAHLSDTPDGADAGRAFVIYGKTDGAEVQLSDVTSGISTSGFDLVGALGGDQSGTAVAGGGDLNGDGFDDLIIGADQVSAGGLSQAGRVYVMYGGPQSLSTEVAAQVGASGVSNALTGTADADTLIGREMPDTLAGNGGVDVFNGGAGDDTIVLNADNVASLNQVGSHIDGGSGLDTVALSNADASGFTLDLTAVADTRISSIERFDISGTADNQLVLSAADLIALQDAKGQSGFNVFDSWGGVAAGTNRIQVVVDGDTGDRLVLAGAATTLVGQVNGYNAYNLRGAQVQLLVDTDVQLGTRAPSVNLSSLTAEPGVRGFVINGEAVADQSGLAVSAAGDVNGDGYGDVIVGASTADPGGRSAAGRSYVVFGGSGNVSVNLSSLTSGSSPQGFVLDGQSVGETSGFSVAGAGDVNGDGLADLIVGARLADPAGRADAGRSYVVFGKTDGSVVNLSALTAGGGSQGFMINGESAVDLSGDSVSAAGDVNGDGLSDVIVGAYGNDARGNNAGRSYVVFGKTSSGAVDLSAVVAASGGFAIDGQAANDSSGDSVSNAGDVNGDGLDDLIVGAWGADPASGVGAGRSYVVFGQVSGTNVQLSALTSGTQAGGFVINGQADSDQSGYAVSDAGDVNGDGLADLIVGARFAGPTGGVNAGRSYVVFGQTGTAPVDLSAIAAGGSAQGFVINGAQADDQSGISVSSAGDLNGDGLDDLLVGAPYSDPAGGTSAGRSYVVFGKTGDSAVELSALSASTATEGFVINGESADDRSGYSVSGAGDVNGDGFDDLIVGAYLADAAGVVSSNAGRSYVIYGGPQYLGVGVAAQVGVAGEANTLTGTVDADTLIGRELGDTLIGGGSADAMYGAMGDDRLVLNADNLASLGAPGARADGGTGVDTLALSNTEGAGMVLDLTAIGNTKLSGIERFDITGTANNRLVLSAADLLALQDVEGASGFNVFDSWGGVAAGTNRIQVVVDGDAGDQISLADATGWSSAGTVTRDDVTYTAYNHASVAAQILLDHSVTTNVI
jgi:hypothetical protein